MPTLTLTATSVGILYGLVYFRTGHGPLTITIRLLLCLQAVAMAIRLATIASIHVFRSRYRECLSDAIRSY